MHLHHLLNQLHLVDQFDQVIFVDGGLVKFGTHDSLLANCKRFIACDVLFVFACSTHPETTQSN